MPVDYTIHPKSLKSKAIRKSDFIDHPWLQNDAKKEALFRRCTDVVANGFSKAKIAKSFHAGKVTVKIKSLEHELVLRLVGRSVQRLTAVRQSNRIQIVRSLKVLLAEGVDYRVYRLDLKSFFESVDPKIVLDQLENDRGFSRQSLGVLREFFRYLSKIGIAGLPRGVAISSVLSEYVLRSFDERVYSHHSVFYYNRFVDDIIVVTSGSENPKKQILAWRRSLPAGLELNSKKCHWIDCSSEAAAQNPEQEIEYLGYKFKIQTKSKKNSKRCVSVDISEKKLSKIKTRVILSSIQYCRDKNFEDLRDRIRLLCSNTTVYDHARGIKRKVGIYYNYELVDFTSSKSLIRLDEFLRSFILNKSGRISIDLNSKLSAKERRRLLKFSFLSGFERRTHTSFQGARLQHLMECWKHA